MTEGPLHRETVPNVVGTPLNVYRNKPLCIHVYVGHGSFFVFVCVPVCLIHEVGRYIL